MANSTIDGNWFKENTEGFCVGLQIEEILYKGTSKFQDILVFKSRSFGNVLVLDGVIQCTERDEFAYQEMIAHLPLNCHPNPRKVLIVGGGDGGVVREVLKHSSVEKVILCEIDEEVISVCKKYLPSMAHSFDDPRLELVIGDGIQYMRNQRDEFDVIITDSTDIKGPAAELFEADYYNNMKRALKPNGVVCCQVENMFLELPLIKRLNKMAQGIFSKVGYAYTMIPSCAGGHNGILLCSCNAEANLCEPLKKYTDEELRTMKLRYYNTDIHKACFTVPQFVKEELGLCS